MKKYFFILLILPLLGLTPKNETPPPALPNNYALFFAVNDYDSPKLRDLNNPIPNAKSIAALLKNDYGFQTEIVENPSLEQIDRKLKAYKEAFQRGGKDRTGQLLVFFSGHGSIESNTGFFLLKDTDPDRLRYTAIDYPYWRNFLNEIPCQHIFVAIDACYSVRFDPLWKSRPEGRFRRVGELNPREQLLANHAQTQTRIFFTSDGKGEETPDKSNFAKKFKEGLLSGGGADHILTSTELYAYVETARPRPHCSEFGDDKAESSFLFVRKQQDGMTHAEMVLKAWEKAQEENTVLAYQNFVKKYPESDFVALASKEIKKKKNRSTRLTRTPSPISDIFLSGKGKDLPGPNMVLIKRGTFEMGCTSEQQDCGHDETRYYSSIPDFLIGKYEVTFEAYDLFCEAVGKEKPHDKGWGRGKRPVIFVSWYDAVAYCNWLSLQHGFQPAYTIDKSQMDPDNHSKHDQQKWLVRWNSKANGFRLPTETEWEFAARQRGEKVMFGNGKDTLSSHEANFDGHAWYSKPYSKVGWSRNKTIEVGSLNFPNKLGLHDMSGNVSEWCWDWREPYPTGSKTSYKGPSIGKNRVIRGGNWHKHADVCRVSARQSSIADSHHFGTGFRLAKTP